MSRFSRVLVDQGIQKGDIVLIYMPMVPQAVVAMLATARLGAIHSLVFGGFASKELSVRINHCKVSHSSFLVSQHSFPRQKTPHKIVEMFNIPLAIVAATKLKFLQVKKPRHNQFSATSLY